MKWFGGKVSKIKDELQVKRPLPVGVTEFHEWADRIIAGTMLPADPESLKFALANDLMHLPPTTAFEQDIYFIHKLRKYAVNQVADAIRIEIRDKAKARLAAEEAEKNATQNPEAEVTPIPNGDTDGRVLEIKKV